MKKKKNLEEKKKKMGENENILWESRIKINFLPDDFFTEEKA